MGYDRRDLKIPLLTKWTIGITAGCAICFAIAFPIYSLLSGGGLLGFSRQPAPATRNNIKSPNPLLQDNFTTKTDIQTMRRHEDEVMTHYSWDDQSKGIAHIPIERAEELILEKGVSTGNEVPAKTVGNTIQQNAVGPGTSGQR
ncbi:MAG: hypothetical protein JST12_11570 [Armatimonadetes bacterium]|nr:hypothetical protein [Armatimonadota bacterium]MBS1727126.1 hypothetical protein [Armatimonadota bacterium]